MAKGVLIEIRGLKELQNKVGRVATDVITEVDNKMHMAANSYASKAVKAAPVDEGTLRQMISAKKNGVMDYEVVSAAFYSPYIEWGTKSKVQVPSDLAAYAKEWENKKITKDGFYEFVTRILDWMKRKGISAGQYSVKTRRRLGNKQTKFEEDLKLATAIVYSILKNGIRPQPFFFKHRKEVYAQLQKDLSPAAKKALKK